MKKLKSYDQVKNKFVQIEKADNGYAVYFDEKKYLIKSEPENYFLFVKLFTFMNCFLDDLPLNVNEKKIFLAEHLDRLMNLLTDSRAKLRPNWQDKNKLDAFQLKERLAFRTFIEAIDKNKIPIKSEEITTGRLSYCNDEKLFSALTQVNSVKYDRDKLNIELLKVQSSGINILFDQMSPLEKRMYFLIKKIHFEQKQPKSVLIPRELFIAKLGLTYGKRTGARTRSIKKIESLLKKMDNECYRITGSDKKGITLNKSIRMPRFGKITVTDEKKNTRVGYEFSDFDTALFSYKTHYNMIDDRPFQYTIENLGLTKQCENVLNAISVILFEAQGLKRKNFTVKLSTLKMSFADFSNHAGRRGEAIRVLQEALPEFNIYIDKDAAEISIKQEIN